MEFRIGDALDRIRRAKAGEASPPVGHSELKPQAAAVSTQAAKPAADSPARQGEMPSGPALALAERARQFPRDAARWETLLHNAWRIDARWFWTLAALRLGGCQVVPHKEAGWALRFDAAAVDELRRQTGDGMLFSGEADYREYVARHLAPRRDELTEILRLSSLGRLVDEDMSWAFSPGVRRVG